MAKDVKDYIQRCPACWQEKAQVQSYPLYMTEIPDQPFDKIAMDLVTDFTESNKGKKTYPYYHRPTNGMARSNTNPKQVC